MPLVLGQCQTSSVQQDHLDSSKHLGGSDLGSPNQLCLQDAIQLVVAASHSLIVDLGSCETVSGTLHTHGPATGLPVERTKRSHTTEVVIKAIKDQFLYCIRGFEIPNGRCST